MTPDKNPLSSTRPFLTTTDHDAPRPVNQGAGLPAPIPPNMTQAEARHSLAQDGMDIDTGSDSEEDHGRAGGMKRRQPETGFDADSTNEPTLRRRAPVSTLNGMPPVDREAERATALLYMGANDELDHQGRTALMLAAKEGRAWVVRQLLSLSTADTQVAALDDWGRNALMLAAKKGHEGVVRQLLALPSADTQAEATDDDGWNALMFAANDGREGVVQHLLALPSADTQAVATTIPSGVNALMMATGGEYDGVVKQLLSLPSADTQVAAQDNEGMSALMLAAEDGLEEVVRQLLAVPSAAMQVAALSDDGGSNALMVAVMCRRDGVVRQLLALSPALAAMQAAATNRDGRNALMFAATKGNAAVVQYLLSLPCATSQLKAVSVRGDTAVSIACHPNRNGPVLALLLAAGGRAAQDHDLVLTHVMGLARQGHPAFLWKLPPNEVRPVITSVLQRGGSLHAVDEQSWNALMYACFAGRGDVVEALLEQGVEASAPMPAVVSAGIRDLLQWRWIMTATAAQFDAAKRRMLPDAASIRQRCLSGMLAFDGSPNSLAGMGVCHTLSEQLILSDSDKNSLFQALAGAAGLSAVQHSLMQAGLLSWLNGWALQHGAAELGRMALSTPTRQRLEALVMEQAGQLEAIGADIEAQVLGRSLPDLDDFCVTHIAGLDSAMLGDDAALTAHIAGLGETLAGQFGLVDVFTQRVRQALVEALQACRGQLTPLLAAMDARALAAMTMQPGRDVADWDIAASLENIDPENWRPYLATLGEVLPQNEAAVATLQQTFKARLKDNLDQVDGRSTLRHAGLAGASSTVQELYEHVVFRQLHMLNQFVNR